MLHNKNEYMDKIASLREMMALNGWDAVVISGSDPHTSEYPAPRWQQVKWLTGFTGEAGDVVVTQDHVGLWTDSRYFIQALEQLEGTQAQLHKTRVPGEVGIPQWLAGRAVRVAVDGLCQSVSAVADMAEAISCREDAVIVDVPDMLSELWADRPQIPCTPVTTLDVECFGGVPRTEKMTWLRKWMLLQGVDQVLLSSLDEIAWMLNVRGSDIEYNPLVISYLLVSQDRVRWFVRKPDGIEDPDTLDSFNELEADGVEIEDYDALSYSLSDEGPDVRIFIDPSTLNYHIYSNIKDNFAPDHIVEGTSPVILEKSVKSPSEIENLRQTYIEDGVAMERFLHWLETEVASGREVTEWEASERLTTFRAEIPGYRGNSFENISAYRPGAALPHYITP